MDQKRAFTRQSQPDEPFRGKPWDDKLNSEAITQRNCFEDETSPVLAYVNLCGLFLHAAKASGLCVTHCMTQFFSSVSLFLKPLFWQLQKIHPVAEQESTFSIGLAKKPNYLIILVSSFIQTNSQSFAQVYFTEENNNLTIMNMIYLS